MRLAQKSTPQILSVLAIVILLVVLTYHGTSPAFVALFVLLGAFLFVPRLMRNHILRELDVELNNLLQGKKPVVTAAPRVQQTLNALHEVLKDKQAQIARQRNERETVLGEMREGVIAINKHREVFRMNRAAFEILGTPPRQISRTPLDEVVEQERVLSFAEQVLQTRIPQEEEIEVVRNGERQVINLYARNLLDARNDFLGILIVLSDITKVRQLEQLKSEFVANVSHELKTPITSIKGFAETLLSGALDDREEAARFVGIIGRQADRLNAIIDDLLTLSSLEQGKESVSLMPVSLRQIAMEAVEVCEAKAKEKQIGINVIGDDIEAMASAPLLVQAVVNLLDNAIKYSEANTSIDIAVERINGGTRLSVSDQGRGIDREHLPRLFERFYRVDKARSRKEGGTGLGLAIVKHIMQINGGSVEVTSSPGNGSKFSLSFWSGSK